METLYDPQTWYIDKIGSLLRADLLKPPEVIYLAHANLGGQEALKRI